MSPRRLEQPFFGTDKPERPRHCGTPSGYTGHRRRGEDPCGACREARNLYQRSRRAILAGEDFAGFSVSDAVDILGGILHGSTPFLLRNSINGRRKG